MNLRINGTSYTLDAPPDEPLLWALRDALGLTGTKFGCGVGICGACTVHINGAAVRSCIMPLAAVAEADIRTIEGLAETDGNDVITLHPAPAGFYRSPGTAVRLVYERPDHAGGLLPGAESAADRRGDRARHERKLLPLRLLCTHQAGHSAGRD